MIMLFMLNIFVYQNGDTLLFTERDSIIDRWILGETFQQIDSLEETIIKNAKISSNNEFFFIHEEKYAHTAHTQSKIVLYNKYRERVWADSTSDSTFITFELSNIYDSLLIVVTAERNGWLPSLSAVKDSKEEILIERGDWNKIIDYKISPNNRYLLFHNKKPYSGKNWDHIYFIDLETKKEWQYLFPTCVSCKRSRIKLHIDDEGKAELVYKTEHRIFSKEGKLIDIFFGSE